MSLVCTVLPANGFSPADTFLSGQCFRWNEQDDGSFCGITDQRVLRVFCQGNLFFAEGISPAEFDRCGFGRYFDLDRDYASIAAELSGLSPVMREACAMTPGVRILRQDPWETLCSFILSQNNNIPRIKGIVSRLCEQFGTPCGQGQFSFPSAQVLAAQTPESLAPLRSGFRAKYLLDAAQKVASGALPLDSLADSPLPEARAALQTVSGVGPKVAECVLLYGLGRLEAFPVDVWIGRAMTQLFPGKTPEFFGPYAGIAQQFLFCYCRRINLKSSESFTLTADTIGKDDCFHE